MEPIYGDVFDPAAASAVLGRYASDERPRLFALYGTYRNDGTPFVGWGVDFGDERGALFYEPDASTNWHSSSAEDVLSTHELIADSHLIWLDPTGHNGRHD